MMYINMMAVYCLGRYVVGGRGGGGTVMTILGPAQHILPAALSLIIFYMLHLITDGACTSVVSFTVSTFTVKPCQS